MDTIEIRPAVPSDAGPIADYHQRCLEVTFAAEMAAGTFAAPDLSSTRRQLRAWFEPGSDFPTDVAVADGRTIGHVTVSGHQLVHLFVTPEHHGTGLGRRLLEHGESKLAANGHSSFELHTRTENTTAVSFYQHAGWTLTDALVETSEHGTTYTEHVMIRPGREGR